MVRHYDRVMLFRVSKPRRCREGFSLRQNWIRKHFYFMISGWILFWFLTQHDKGKKVWVNIEMSLQDESYTQENIRQQLYSSASGEKHTKKSQYSVSGWRHAHLIISTYRSTTIAGSWYVATMAKSVSQSLIFALHSPVWWTPDTWQRGQTCSHQRMCTRH